jgi:hypothetical protein
VETVTAIDFVAQGWTAVLDEVLVETLGDALWVADLDGLALCEVLWLVEGDGLLLL